ncbi:MAG: hypothetical protein NC078_09695 [Ruminococcus sp.]|nr:hypothetical protein [Ruminococcus sp.]
MKRKMTALLTAAAAFGYLFVYPDWRSLGRAGEEQRFEFDEQGTVPETEFGYDITFGDTFVYLKNRRNFLFSKVIARIRFTSDEDNELEVYCPDGGEIIAEYYANGRKITLSLDPKGRTACY